MSEKQVRKEMSILPLRWVQTMEILPRQHIIIFESCRLTRADDDLRLRVRGGEVEASSMPGSSRQAGRSAGGVPTSVFGWGMIKFLKEPEQTNAEQITARSASTPARASSPQPPGFRGDPLHSVR